ETDHRPAVILALDDDVDLVAAAWAMLDLPDIASCRVDRQALLVAMAITPDLRLGAVAADEGIVRGSRSVRRTADHFAQMIGVVRRFVAGAEMFAERDEQIAVIGLRYTAPIMVARRQRAFLPEDHLGLVEPAAAVVEFGARHRGAAAA